MTKQVDGIFSIAATSAALPSRILLDTYDLDEAVTVVSGVLSRHDIRLDGPRSEFRAQVRDYTFGDLRLAHFNYGTAFTVQTEPLDSYVVNFTLSGRSTSQHGAARVSAQLDEATVFSPHGASSMIWTPEVEVLSLIIPRASLEQHFRKLSGVSGGDIVFDPSVKASEAHLLRSIVGSTLSAAAADSLSAPPEALSWQLRDAVLTAMLLELQHNRCDVLRRLREGSARRICDAAIATMRRELSDPPSMPALATHLGVSERYLQLTFRDYLNTTPSAKLKQLRLEAVHDALLAAPAKEKTVTRVAASVGGFFNLGRFASEYFEMFGEHPSETLRRHGV